MKKINNKQQTKKVETKIMLNTRLVHGPSAILELHMQSVRGQKFTSDIKFHPTFNPRWPSHSKSQNHKQVVVRKR